MSQVRESGFFRRDGISGRVLASAVCSGRSLVLWALAVPILLIVCLLVVVSLPPTMRPMVFTIAAARDKSLVCLGSHQSQLAFLDLEKHESWVVRCSGSGIIDENALSPTGDFVAVSHVRTLVMEVSGQKLGTIKIDRPRHYFNGPRPPENIRFAGENGNVFVIHRRDEWDVVRLNDRDPGAAPVFVGWDIGWSDRRKRGPLPTDIANNVGSSSGLDYDDESKLGVVGFADGRLMEFNSLTDEWRMIHQFGDAIATAKWLDTRHVVVGLEKPTIVVCDREGNESCRIETPASLLAVSRSKPWVISGQIFGAHVNVWRFENDQLILDWECDVNEEMGIKPWSTWSQLLGR